MQFYVIADEDTVAGFGSVGVSGKAVPDARAAGAELDRLAAQRAELVVIITERLAERIREKVNAIRFGEALPLIVEIAGPAGPMPGGPSLLKLISDAVGVKL